MNEIISILKQIGPDVYALFAFAVFILGLMRTFMWDDFQRWQHQRRAPEKKPERPYQKHKRERQEKKDGDLRLKRAQVQAHSAGLGGLNNSAGRSTTPGKPLRIA